MNLSDWFPDLPSKAAAACVVAGPTLAVVVDNLIEDLPSWIVVVSVMAFVLGGVAVWLWRNQTSRRGIPRRMVSREERAYMGNWYVVTHGDTETQALTVHHAARLKWNGKEVHWKEIVDWVRKGARDPVSRARTLRTTPSLDDPYPEDIAVRLVQDGIFTKSLESG